jgi:hypothetical protein
VHVPRKGGSSEDKQQPNILAVYFSHGSYVYEPQSHAEPLERDL